MSRLFHAFSQGLLFAGFLAPSFIYIFTPSSLLDPDFTWQLGSIAGSCLTALGYLNAPRTR